MVNIKRSELKKLAIDKFGSDSLENQQLIAVMIGVARAARTSYTTVGEDGKEIPYEKDIALHDSLLSSGHMSPTEHIAQAQDDSNMYANFKGFKQYRKFLEENSVI
jgi:hypothetical protein